MTGKEGTGAARSQAHAALVRPQKRDLGRVSVAVRARARPGFGPGVVPLAPFPLVPIKTPLGSEEK